VALAERIRDSVARTEVNFEGKMLRVTVSVGVASLAACETDATPAQLLALADAALYRAKEGGRNRVAVAPLP
jgi:diguanylate cyclase (GGDEF)-like protein